MKEEQKTKKQLINEIKELRQRIAELEKKEMEHKQIEIKLRESEEKYRTLTESSLTGIFIYQDGKYIFVNDKFAEIHGYKPEELIGKDPLILIHPDDRKTLKQVSLKRQKGRVISQRYEIRKIRKDGKTIWCETIATLIRYKGRPAIMGNVIDITQRKQAEENLRESEEIFKSISAAAQDGIIMIDNGGNILYWNKAAQRIFGYTKKEAIGKEVHIFLAPEKYHKAYKKGFSKFKKTGQGPVIGKTLQFLAVRKDGVEFPIELSVSAMRIRGKWHSIGIVRDITQRKQAEEKLRESEEKYASLIHDAIDSLPSGIFILDRDFKIVWANRTIEDFLGIDKNSLIGCDKRKVIKERIKYIFEDPEQFEEVTLRTYKNNTYAERFECHVLPSGKRKERFLLHWSIPIRTGALVGGRVEHYYDITEQKRAKEKLQQSYNKLKKTFWQIVRTLSAITEIKDPYTAGHQWRVTKLACAIATEMGFPNDRIEKIYIAGLLHDLGKIAIPAEILNKSRKLTEAEYNLIKTHSQIGYDILKNIEFSEPIAQIVLQHHEMIDGSGYPQGLKGKEILLEAKILAVADVVEAMSFHRPYRPALGLDKALEEISKNKGILYDPKVVDTCLKLFTEKGFRFE